jgi:phenylacetate-CoA ligase
MDIFSIYSKMPVSVQNVLCSIEGYRLKNQRFNKTFDEILAFLNTTHHWTSDQILAYKEEHLSKIIGHAFNTCPYYKKKYSNYGLTPADFKCLDDLQKFPILTKEEVRLHWKAMVSLDFTAKDLIHYHTSGTTGTALDFYWTRYSIPYYWAMEVRYKKRFCNTQELNLALTGKPTVSINVNKPPYWRFVKPFNQYRIDMQHIAPNKINDIVNFINHKHFGYFGGYCSILTALALEIEDAGLKIEHPPSHIFTGSETLYDYQIDIIKRVFENVQIHLNYSFSEQAAFASHCINNKYHEDFEFGHIELVNTIFHQNGRVGEILATGFMNFGMPFIRYEVGDTAVFSDIKCKCGSKAQIIDKIMGRTEDYIITPEGVKLQRFDYLFKDTNQIKECQVVQKQFGEVLLRIVKRANYSIVTEQELIKKINIYISPTIAIKFEYVNEIPRTKAGKFKAVVSELSKNKK